MCKTYEEYLEEGRIKGRTIEYCSTRVLNNQLTESRVKKEVDNMLAHYESVKDLTGFESEEAAYEFYVSVDKDQTSFNYGFIPFEANVDSKALGVNTKFINVETTAQFDKGDIDEVKELLYEGLFISCDEQVEITIKEDK